VRTAEIKSKSNIFTSSAKGYVQVECGKSTVRFKAKEAIVFIVRVSNHDRDPLTLIRLLRFEAKKDSRRIQLSEASVQVWGSKVSTTALRSLFFEVEKHGASSFKIILRHGLLPGEYALDSIESTGLFCLASTSPHLKGGP
jgi:hypothetical protein